MQSTICLFLANKVNHQTTCNYPNKDHRKVGTVPSKHPKLSGDQPFFPNFSKVVTDDPIARSRYGVGLLQDIPRPQNPKRIRLVPEGLLFHVDVCLPNEGFG